MSCNVPYVVASGNHDGTSPSVFFAGPDAFLSSTCYRTLISDDTISCGPRSCVNRFRFSSCTGPCEASCGADSQCDGVMPGTGNCDSNCHYVTPSCKNICTDSSNGFCGADEHCSGGNCIAGDCGTDKWIYGSPQCNGECQIKTSKQWRDYHCSSGSCTYTDGPTQWDYANCGANTHCSSGSCVAGVESIGAGNCHDGKDNDCDGKVDCADPDCASDTTCYCWGCDSANNPVRKLLSSCSGGCGKGPCTGYPSSVELTHADCAPTPTHTNLVVSNIQKIPPFKTGSKSTFTITVSNEGNTQSGSYTVKYEIINSTGDVINSSIAAGNPALPGGKSRKAFSFWIPTEPGFYTFKVTVTDGLTGDTNTTTTSFYVEGQQTFSAAEYPPMAILFVLVLIPTIAYFFSANRKKLKKK
ncbi:MAG: hypothetical protein J7L23_03840 [Candidatus Diapherotrites archaeon]|nr:hypothetical protein [Candidatus Diapherotrites archaeon]